MKASESRDCQEGFDLGDFHCSLADLRTAHLVQAENIYLSLWVAR